jgi:hypothetical protein
MGITLEQFWTLNPRKIKAILKGHNNLLKERDRENWINGQYMISAIAAALNSKAKYIEEPLLEKAEKENKPLSHEEQMEKVKRVFQSLQIMQSNFELSKMKKENEGGAVS